VNGLRPFPFAALLHRLRHELESGVAVFELPRRDWHRPRPGLDLSFHHAGRRAANPCGPAAGPHTQLAQNMVQGWLAGARVFELKTIQVLDRLNIPRPCIHVPHYGLNVEWSQELSLPVSVREYQKAAWLLEILRRGRAGGALPEGSDLDTVLDLSVGYSLDGVRSPALSAALEALRRPAEGWRDLERGLPAELRAWAGDPPAGPIADCVTLSTFHGCPPGEIEAIAGHLLEQGWSVIVKLNPTLLGLAELRHLLHERLGYHHLELDPSAIAEDLDLDGAVRLLGRLRRRAGELGRHLGAKFTNTLVVARDARIFPPEAGPRMYLSGTPLHPLALAAAARVAAALDHPLPLSFSAGVDRLNAADTLACGFAPLTLCTDLLRRGGQGRLARVLAAVEERLVAAGCSSLAAWQGESGDEAAVWRERVRRLRDAAERAAADPRHQASQVMRPPRKVGSALERLDCLSCDLCLPACPNLALFSWETPPGGGLRERRQIGVLADACNACSNCETWCPEEGAPWRVKERWHQDRASLEAASLELEGWCWEAGALVGRVDGGWVRLAAADDETQWRLEAGGGSHLATEGGGALPAALRPLLARALLVWRGLARDGANPAGLLREAGEGRP
jgi:putative selenate reductase